MMKGWRYAGRRGVTGVLLWVAAAMLLALLGGCKAKKAAGPAGPKTLEGKPVQEWVGQLNLRTAEPVSEALRVLAKAPPSELQPARTKLEAIFEKWRDESQLVAGRAAVLLVGRLGQPLEERHRSALLRLLILEDDVAMRRLMEEVLRKAVADGDDVVYERALNMALDGRHGGSEAASAREILLGDRAKSIEIINRLEAEAMAEAKAKGREQPEPWEREARRKALEVLK